jgi:hypothetical protein
MRLGGKLVRAATPEANDGVEQKALHSHKDDKGHPKYELIEILDVPPDIR